MSSEADQPTVLVTVDNFIGAESEVYLRGVNKDFGFGKLGHRREPAPTDNQTATRLKDAARISMSRLAAPFVIPLTLEDAKLAASSFG